MAWLQLGLKGRRALVGVLATLLAASGAVVPVTATADEPPASIPWPDLLPALNLNPSSNEAEQCRSGDSRCVDAVIREMERRFRPQARACDHDAVFSLFYLRTTEEYRRAIADPSFFADTRWVNTEDAVFAAAYFAPYDAWHSGRRDAVPPAWQVAFDAADRRLVSGSGNLLLGVNAHINRDLPFVLATVGLTDPSGASRKPDHDQVNEFLKLVTEPVVAEAARRLDPTIDDGYVDGTTADETLTFQTVAAWREEAWRNAERLVGARSPEERAAVAESIEQAAAAEARAIVAARSYPPLTSSQTRDLYCAEHG